MIFRSTVQCTQPTQLHRLARPCLRHSAGHAPCVHMQPPIAALLAALATGAFALRLLPWLCCRSCRTRLESHKIRQREHHNRRVAAAAAAMQQQVGAAASAISTPPPPAAAPGVHLPDISGGQACSGLQVAGQQLPLGGTHLGTPQPWAPLQRPALWQQDKETMDSLAGRRNTLHTSMVAPAQLQQQPQQRPLQSAAGLTAEPSIFADMPQEELPLAMHVGRQVISCTNPGVLPPLSAFCTAHVSLCGAMGGRR